MGNKIEIIVLPNIKLIDAYILSEISIFIRKTEILLMSRRERRANARRAKIENLHRPVKANRGILITVAIFTVIVVIATYFIRYSNA
jgi:hypothetical protein